MNNILSCKELKFKYQENLKENIVNKFSYNFLEGKNYLITGNSGCGKSTLAYILAGLYPEHKGVLSSGEIKLFGKNISKYPSNERVKEIMMMFQNSDAQFCMERVKDEIIFCLENIAYPVEKMDNLIDQVLKETDILHLKDKKLSLLSGGEKQKVALAIILAISPKIIILDEPFANVDYESSQEIILKLKNLTEKKRTTIIAIDHRINLWKNMEFEILFLEAGCKISEKYFYFEEKKKIFEENKKTILENKEIILKLENVSIGYENNILLKNCSLEVKKGEIISIVGKSGVGKSSLLLNIAGIINNKKGIIKFLDKDIKKLKTKEILENIGIVFQNPQNQFITYKVIDELIFSMKQTEKDNEKILKKAEDLLKKFNLYEYKNYSPFYLSQGQQRKLAVLSMLVGNQKLLLCDEPTYGQDNKTSKELMEFLKKRTKDDLSVIIVSHDKDLVYEYSDSIYELTQNKELRRIR